MNKHVKRHIVHALERYASSFPSVLVTGARQTGKTTLLSGLKKETDIPYVTFDDPSEQLSAVADSKTFLLLHPQPVIFDEIQYVPQLFPYLKMAIDADRHNGMFYLSGSQQFHLMKNVSESLAGRIGILHLTPFSLRERFEDSYTSPFIPSKDFLLQRKPSCKPLKPLELWSIIQGGSYPEVFVNSIQSQDFYSSYVKTYIERDVRNLTQIGDELLFLKFVSVTAARTAQLVNYADIARTTGISEGTAKKWLSVLVSSGLVYLLQPYSSNVEKRVVKTPKLYFMDTGLAAYLTKWHNSGVLMSGAMAGAYFETFVITEILKGFYNNGLEPPVYFYRDKDKIEIDLLIEDNGILYPVEIKMTSSPSKKDAASFSILQRTHSVTIAPGIIVCTGSSLKSTAPDVLSVPVEYL